MRHALKCCAEYVGGKVVTVFSWKGRMLLNTVLCVVITTFNSAHNFHATAFCVCVAFDKFWSFHPFICPVGYMLSRRRKTGPLHVFKLFSQPFPFSSTNLHVLSRDVLSIQGLDDIAQKFRFPRKEVEEVCFLQYWLSYRNSLVFITRWLEYLSLLWRCDNVMFYTCKYIYIYKDLFTELNLKRDYFN